MRTRARAGLRAAGLLTVACVLCAAASAPAVASEPDTGWQPDLSAGRGAGVVVQDGEARLDPGTARGAPAGESTGADTEAAADVVPTGLLTLPGHTLDRPAATVSSRLDARLGPGSTVTLDVRGKRAGGGWTEWIPSEPGARPGSGVAELPEPAQEVQGRLVLTATGDDRPSVRSVTLSATPGGAESDAQPTDLLPRSYSVFATREGLTGGTTANGHRIARQDRFVALPSRRALSANGSSDYSVKVCAPNGRCAFAPVWDIGPWNTKDDYWNPGNRRESFTDLPQGVPEAQAAFRNGYNGGKDQFGRRPSNPSGIDLSDGMFWDALGLKDNSQVTVDYLWTGTLPLARVTAEGSAADVPVYSAPGSDAPVVGVAADKADVPVQCRVSDGWVRLGDRQYLPASALEGTPADTPACGP